METSTRRRRTWRPSAGSMSRAIQESPMNIDEQNGILAQLNEDLEAHLKSCSQQTAALNGQVAIVRDDLIVVIIIIEAVGIR